ncbi:hypothetical protein CLIB1423_33S00650 [[Candida] railenensis]|uniref:F-box domain-containing protein n=1 Tax=[Candida] railenensis TaxID=45579 RepID=A0A9P0QVC7_9ASCO|nr:hypothetical protein CLIB1423_33S00650 [[Candida] railenensis]
MGKFELVGLPEEVVLLILGRLSPNDTLKLISALGHSGRSRSCDTLKIYALQRLYCGRTIVYSSTGNVEGRTNNSNSSRDNSNSNSRSDSYNNSNNDNNSGYVGSSGRCSTCETSTLQHEYKNEIEGNHPGPYDTLLEFSNFRESFVDSEPGLNDIVFRKTRPQSLEFHFHRYTNDYIRFVNDLRSFGDFMNSVSDSYNIKNYDFKKDTITEYLRTVHRLEVYIDGNSDDTELPSTALPVAVLWTMVKLSASNSLLRERIQCLSICSTNLGDHFQIQWSQLFDRFENLHTLNLSQNKIRSITKQDNQSWLAHVKWPPRLRYLNLDDNMIREYISELLATFPKSLEVLSMKFNLLDNFGGHSNDSTSLKFKLSEILPNLKSLDLSCNRFLAFVNPEILNATGSLHTLDVSDCYIDNHSMTDLKRVAKRERIELRH